MTTNETTCHLSVVIPAYNEEARIGTTLQHVLEYLEQQDYTWEVLVVDDGSTDGTVAVVEQAAAGRPVTVLPNGVNRGKGFSVCRGVLASRGRHIVFSDADESTPIQEVSKLLPKCEEGYGVVMGSRAVDRSTIKVHQPWYRELMGRIFNLFVRLITVGRFADTQCGFKCFSREAAQAIFPFQRISGFSFDVETVFLALKFGYRVTEVPVEWYNSPRSTVHPILDSLRMFRDLVVIRLNDWRGYYDRGRELPNGPAGS
jgi:dolichyl-phosphate beta-glucosyltransferase